MSKVIEDAAQDFAAINDDKAANSAHSYSKYDIADAYQQGADFGYSLAENRIKKEYEEKLRWIPVEEKLPESNKIAIVFKTKTERIYYGFYGLSCNFYVILAELLDKNIQVNEVTHWRYFL